MTSLIDLQRQFEMQVKMMSTAEEMDKSRLIHCSYELIEFKRNLAAHPALWVSKTV